MAILGSGNDDHDTKRVVLRDPLIMIKAAFLAAQMTGEIAERELPDLPRGEQHVPDTAPFPQHLRALLEGSGGQEG